MQELIKVKNIRDPFYLISWFAKLRLFFNSLFFQDWWRYYFDENVFPEQ